ncbi:hypothetical protein E1I18_00185 [Mycoplasmopsis mucosicanis]|uniref:Cell division protein FtsZ n=1 Tax=Mycoplasmopsis mucosicanis TaxID=458208 RepID=A0A507SY51_9BACT|nr:cell division protein FtsZ [Mycoplasmopsis mucosicanis]TQC54182.1 hypothetical protein E1I18_00185 [Mycoplasmopsis mucosicanis]
MDDNIVNIKIIGVGGAGSNIVNAFQQENSTKIELLIANTDNQDLLKSKVENKIFLGKNTRGFGAGGNPEVGAQRAQESIEEIKQALANTDLLIIVSGMGGGTGTGASPVIAEVARELNILTLAIMISPFSEFEGAKINNIAQYGIEKMQKLVNSYVIVNNEKIAEQYEDLPFQQILKIADMSVKNMINIIEEMISSKMHINIDYNDILALLSNGGQLIISKGKAQGDSCVSNAIEVAINSSNYLEKPNKLSSLLLHFYIDQKINYNSLKLLRNTFIEKYQLDQKIHSKIGISFTESNEKHAEVAEFSFIAIENIDKLEIQNVDQSQQNVNTSIEELTSSISIIDNTDTTETNIDSSGHKLPDF